MTASIPRTTSGRESRFFLKLQQCVRPWTRIRFCCGRRSKGPAGRAEFGLAPVAVATGTVAENVVAGACFCNFRRAVAII